MITRKANITDLAKIAQLYPGGEAEFASWAGRMNDPTLKIVVTLERKKVIAYSICFISTMINNETMLIHSIGISENYTVENGSFLINRTLEYFKNDDMPVKYIMSVVDPDKVNELTGILGESVLTYFK